MNFIVERQLKDALERKEMQPFEEEMFKNNIPCFINLNDKEIINMFSNKDSQILIGNIRKGTPTGYKIDHKSFLYTEYCLEEAVTHNPHSFEVPLRLTPPFYVVFPWHDVYEMGMHEVTLCDTNGITFYAHCEYDGNKTIYFSPISVMSNRFHDFLTYCENGCLYL